VKTDCFVTLLLLQFNDNRKSCGTYISDMASVKGALGKGHLWAKIWLWELPDDKQDIHSIMMSSMTCYQNHSCRQQWYYKEKQVMFFHLPCRHTGSSQAWNCAVLSHMQHCVLIFYTCFPWTLSCETFLPPAHISSHILPIVKTYLLQIQWRYIALAEYDNKQ